MATVNTAGVLLQVSRFFPGKESKTGFCVDSPSIVEPYFVIDRLETLFSRATDPHSNDAIDLYMDTTFEFSGPRTACAQVVNDRWPHFTLKTKDDISMETQYVASGGTVYQTVKLDFSQSSRKRELPKISGIKELLIRDLDFIDHANRFNEAESDDSSYETRVSDEGIFVRSHQISSEAHIVLFISVFFESRRLKFVKEGDDDPYLQLSEEALKLFEDEGKFEITVAYTLDYLPRESLTLTTAVSPDCVLKQLKQETFVPQSFTQDPHLDRLLGQNLEYILSVCCIPVTSADNAGIRAIALTCGDLDGHRVATAASLPQGFFAPHYWIDGSRITDGEDNEYLPGKALVDTPFQIIKAGDFQSLLGTGGISEEITNGIKQVASSWIEDLDRSNRLGHEKRVQFDGTTSERKSKKVRNYSSARVQQNILKRLTTENPLSRKRMIAVSRGPGQSRSFLRNKDAVLFHAMELGFFDRPGAKRDHGSWKNKIDVWKNTIDCQIRHEDNDDTGWNEPLRFALSIIMAHNDKQINARSAQDMRTHALSVLLQSYPPNGIFPGALDENNEPMLYSDELMRDTYWGVTFEIPYLLWRYCPRPTDSTPPADTSNQTLQSPTVDKMASAPTHPEFWISLKESLENQVAGKGAANLFGHSMKHSFPFNDVVYQENIVELSDEWLYNEPSFFVPPQDGNSTDDHANNNIPNDQVTRAETEGPWLHRALPMEEVTPDIPFVGIMVDVPKSKHLKKTTPRLSGMMTIFIADTRIQGQMTKGRSPETAKKRFWAFFAKEPSKNTVCCRTSPLCYEDEEEGTGVVKDKEISPFFEKHQTYDKFFVEETESVLNSWTTELHLSFYKVGEKKAVANPTATNAPHTGLLSLLGFVGEHYTQIARVSMSFRFDGDFFDCYWTCWFLEAGSQTQLDFDNARESVQLLLEGGPRRNNETVLQKAPWRQRRVLKLLLFGRAICHMREGADNILRLAKSSIQKKSRNPRESTRDGLEEADELDYNAFLVKRRRFERFQKVLQTVQSDLVENLTRVDQWLAREKERQAERPPWTFNDESRYRSVISKLNFSNDHEAQELRRSYAKIATFNDSIAKKLDIMRNDVDQRRADDIQRFTWVTIFFLPMGFATGVFSMNGAPGGQTLWHMIVTMVGALLVTALLLMYSKTIDKVYEWVSGLVYDFGKGIFGSMRASSGSERKKRDRPTPRQGIGERVGKLFKNGIESDPERGVVTNNMNQAAPGGVRGSQDKLTANDMSNGVRHSGD
ncbi:hypothetical protein FSARC_10087 [Fusarium sarcochroum]|uniref:Uncharacterized protein n=1 Tax=Fusarium sarcochroum TaxID=1208366 RepID=A0A8H4TPN6_9HYPO|nr:hypothetical protein FSARC_10087 [Fusarium sarcochroum]